MKESYLRISNVLDVEQQNIIERGHPHLFPHSEEDLITENDKEE